MKRELILSMNLFMSEKVEGALRVWVEGMVS
jgi:hypothetical protein